MSGAPGEIARMLGRIKAEFAAGYAGGAHVQEVVPVSLPGVPDAHMEALHDFASHNPIYGEPAEQEIAGERCMVYEGDMGTYWLDSTKHGSSCQPFYPTWMASAYVLALAAKGLGYSELVDVGSGDGRIAYCAGVAGLGQRSVEIDAGLVDLQRQISESTGRLISPVCCDALEADYAGMGMQRPVFVIGALAQMGGDMLASGVIGAARQAFADAGVILAGTYSKKGGAGGGSGGWGDFMRRHSLDVTDTLVLPTVWTFDQDEDTPYMHARL